ncbi:methyltransferase domain-containing protein [Glaciecola sp. XM2]|uniref:methyltransferase domain-containing protein n=1 Tax=Glaciecola sp. XM2 TaxID=1914931 RepID=UPI001BDEB8AC|nr:methyltransferase domain-containing protein [Glaciecola sp. XM2]
MHEPPALMQAVKPKRVVAEHFSRAANRYDRHAQIQKEIADGLIDWGSLQTSKSGVALDLGCGTGYLGKRIADGHAQWLNLDVSLEMLKSAKANATERLKLKEHSILADAHYIPLANSSVDRVYSSMALQWCEHPQQVVKEMFRVLKPQGRAVLAIMVSPSFSTLDNAWRAIKMPSRVNAFASPMQWLSAFQAYPWKVRSSEECFYSEHRGLSHMLKSISGVGASAQTALTAQSPLSKNEFIKLDEYFTHQSSLQLDYRVLFIECSK